MDTERTLHRYAQRISEADLGDVIALRLAMILKKERWGYYAEGEELAKDCRLFADDIKNWVLRAIERETSTDTK